MTTYLKEPYVQIHHARDEPNSNYVIVYIEVITTESNYFIKMTAKSNYISKMTTNKASSNFVPNIVGACQLNCKRALNNY